VLGKLLSTRQETYNENNNDNIEQCQTPWQSQLSRALMRAEIVWFGFSSPRGAFKLKTTLHRGGGVLMLMVDKYG